MNKFLLAFLLLPVSFVAKGQGCPNGLVAAPTGACVSQAEANDMRQADYDAEMAARKRQSTMPIWEDRFGAIASDAKTGSIGWSSNAQSKQKAYKAAIEDCGGSGCKITAWVRNDCLAAAWGGGGLGYGNDPDTRKAEAMSLKSCKDVGGKTCKVQYSACSLPVRVR